MSDARLLGHGPVTNSWTAFCILEFQNRNVPIMEILSSFSQQTYRAKPTRLDIWKSHKVQSSWTDEKHAVAPHLCFPLSFRETKFQTSTILHHVPAIWLSQPLGWSSLSTSVIIQKVFIVTENKFDNCMTTATKWTFERTSWVLKHNKNCVCDKNHGPW